MLGCALSKILLIAPVVLAAVITTAAAPALLFVVAPICAVYGATLWWIGVVVATDWARQHQPELLRAVDPTRSTDSATRLQRTRMGHHRCSGRRRARTGMTMAAATRWVTISVSFVAVEADTARSGTSDNAVSTTAVVRKAERRPMKRASRTPTPVKSRVSWAKPASGMAWPSIARGTSIARAATATAVVAAAATTPAARPARQTMGRVVADGWWGWTGWRWWRWWGHRITPWFEGRLVPASPPKRMSGTPIDIREDFSPRCRSSRIPFV